MKRLLVVLFGVLVFQGSVWAKCGNPDDKESAKFLSPGQDSVLIKGAPFVVQWQDDAKYLCKKVKIELIEVSNNKKTKVIAAREDNIGYHTIDKLMASVKDRTSAEKPGHRTKFEYQFRISSIKKACKGAPCQILSKSFTLANAELAIHRKTHGKGSQRDEAVVLATSEVRDALVRLTALEERLGELLSQDGQVAEGAQVINKDSGHEHSDYAAESHPHTSISATSHTHEDYVEKHSVRHRVDTLANEARITTVNSQVSALQAQVALVVGAVDRLMVPFMEMTFPNGTAWQKVVDANEHENESLEACWCNRVNDPVGYCTARGWAVGGVGSGLSWNEDFRLEVANKARICASEVVEGIERTIVGTRVNGQWVLACEGGEADEGCGLGCYVDRDGRFGWAWCR